jgi:hypothetical protein
VFGVGEGECRGRFLRYVAVLIASIHKGEGMLASSPMARAIGIVLLNRSATPFDS